MKYVANVGTVGSWLKTGRDVVVNMLLELHKVIANIL